MSTAFTTANFYGTPKEKRNDVVSEDLPRATGSDVVPDGIDASDDVSNGEAVSAAPTKPAVNPGTSQSFTDTSKPAWPGKK